MNFSRVLQAPLMELDIPNVTKKVPIDIAQMRDIRDMTMNEPSIRMALLNFQDNVLVNPFEVIFHTGEAKAKAKASTNEYFGLRPDIQAMLISKYWMPWLRDLNMWTMMFGFCPFYFKEVRHTVEDTSHTDDDDDDDDADDAGKSAENNNAPQGNTDGENKGPRKRPRPKRNLRQTKDILLLWPTTPDMDMGTVEMFVYKEKCYLIWKWRQDVVGTNGNSNSDMYDLKMYFIIETKPTLETGQCTSRMASLLDKYKHLQVLKRANAELVQAMAMQKHVIEFSPSLAHMGGGNNSDQVYTQGLHPSPFIPGVNVGLPTPTNVTPGERAQSLLSGISAFQNAQMRAAGQTPRPRGPINVGLDPMGMMVGPTPTRSEIGIQRSADELKRFLVDHPELSTQLNVITDRMPGAIYLEAFQRYVHVPGPTASLSAEVAERELQFERMASSVLDSPLELSMGSLTHAPGANEGQANERDFMHRRIRFRIRFFCSAVKQVFKVAFLSMIERIRSDIQRLKRFHDDQPRNLEELEHVERSMDFQIVFKPSAGDLPYTSIVEFYRIGAINEDEAFNMLFQKIGFSDPPSQSPAVFQKRMRELYRMSPEEEHALGQKETGPAKKKPKTNAE
jgi:hypothetical protein